MAVFANFNLFFGISLMLRLNFNDIYAATDIPTYFKIIPIDIFMKTFLKLRTLVIKSDLMTQILGGSKIVSS